VERVGSLLRSLEGAEVLRRRIAESRGLASWREIVGSPLAERTRPLQLAGGRLFVLCHGASLRQELVFHKREILRRFREACGAPVVARELILLESDANLTSLVREAEEHGAGRRACEVAPGGGPAPSGEAAAAAPTGAAAEEPSLAARVAAAYPRFDGAAYREELRRIVDGA
jgi:hypothetical protein